MDKMILEPEVKLIIFDLDGTLIDSEYEVSRITADIACENGCTITPREVFNFCSGFGSKEKFSMIAAREGKTFSEAQLDMFRKEHGDRKTALYDQDHIPLIEGAEETARQAVELNYEICVASSNKTDRIGLALEKTGLDKLFRQNFYGTDLVAEKKPAPDIFLYAMDIYGVKPRHAAIIEDSLAGVIGGKASGGYTLGLLDERYGFGDVAMKKEQDYRAAGASKVIRSFKGFFHA